MNTEELARNVRRHIIRMTNKSKASHVGSGLSMADILAVLYGEILNIRPHEPDWPERDRFILSKGHAAAALYASLAESGFFPTEWLDRYCENGSDLMGHASHGVPGVEFSTGSLGHGLPVAVGLAWSAKQREALNRVICLLSDGECDEGSNWEAALIAGHHRLYNLTIIIDYNKIQSLRPVSETLALEPLDDKWRSFGWRVFRVDGHDHAALRTVLRERQDGQSQPTCVIADTIKGKGVSFMENTVLWHYRSPQGEEYEAAMRELD